MNEGVRVHLIPKNKFSVCCISVMIVRQLRREEVTKNALIAKILKLGSEKYPSVTQIGKAADELDGGRVDIVNMKKGNYQIIDFYAEVLDKNDNPVKAAKLLSELMLKPLTEGEGFKNEYVIKAKKELRDAIRAKADDKREYAKNRLIEEMFSEEPFGIYGDGYEDDIDKITAEELLTYYNDIVTDSRTEIIAAGSFDSDKLKKAVEIFDTGARKTDDTENVNFSGRKKGLVTENMEVAQSKLCAGFSSASDYYSLICANEILGGGANSRLFMNVREKEGLCYYISTSVSRGVKAVILQAGISAESLDKVVSAANSTLGSFGEITDYDIERAKSDIVRKYTLMEDSCEGIMNICLNGILYGGEKDVESFCEKVKAVGNDTVRKAFDGCELETVFLLKEGRAVNENS